MLGALLLAAAVGSYQAQNVTVATAFDAALRAHGDASAAVRIVAPAAMQQILGILEMGSAGSTQQAIRETVGSSPSFDPAQWRAFFAVPSDVRTGNALWNAGGFEGTPEFSAYATAIGMPINPHFGGKSNLGGAVHRWLRDVGAPNAPVKILPGTDLLGVNVLQIDANWKDQFEPRLSHPGVFHAAGADRAVTFMHREGWYRAVHADGFSAIQMPYTDGLSLWLAYAPDGMSDVSRLLAAVDGRRGTCDCTIELPRLRVEASNDYAKLLETTPLRALFDTNADFRPMTGTRGPLDGFVQILRLSIDERGTQAVAVTQFSRIKSMTWNLHATFDHPFAFAIRNDATGAYLLTGTILDPQIEESQHG